MRLKIAIVLAVLGLVVLGLGIGQRTIWLPPASLTASTPSDVSPAPLTVISPELLKTRDGQFSLTVKNDGPIQLAVAREKDIIGWIGDAGYTMIGGADADYSALTAESHKGAETVPNPAGSDMWVSEEKGADQMTYTWQAPGHGDWALLLSSDGTAPAPSNISITVDNETGTPWAVPLMVIGSALLALAALLFLLAPRKRAEAVAGRRSATRAAGDPATGALEVDKIVAAREGARTKTAGSDSSDVSAAEMSVPGVRDRSARGTADVGPGAVGAAAAGSAVGSGLAAGDAASALPSSLKDSNLVKGSSAAKGSGQAKEYSEAKPASDSVSKLSGSGAGAETGVGTATGTAAGSATSKDAAASTASAASTADEDSAALAQGEALAARAAGKKAAAKGAADRTVTSKAAGTGKTPSTVAGDVTTSAATTRTAKADAAKTESAQTEDARSGAATLGADRDGADNDGATKNSGVPKDTVAKDSASMPATSVASAIPVSGTTAATPTESGETKSAAATPGAGTPAAVIPTADGFHGTAKENDSKKSGSSNDDSTKNDSASGPDGGSGGGNGSGSGSGKDAASTAHNAGKVVTDAGKKIVKKAKGLRNPKGTPDAKAPKDDTGTDNKMTRIRWGAALAAVLMAGTVGPATAAETTPASSETAASSEQATTAATAATTDDDATGVPNLLDSQVQRIIDSVASVVASGDNAKNAKELEPRVAGMALQVRTANYKIRATVSKQAAVEPVNASKLLTRVVSTTDTWPRTAMVVTQGENNALPQLLTLAQASPRENYKLIKATPLLPGQTFPSVDKEGTKQIALDSDSGLLMSPSAAVAALSDRLTKEDSKFKDSFSDSVYIDSVFAAQKKVVADAKDADTVFTHKGDLDSAVSLRTADGGAIVVVGYNFGIDATSKEDATLTVGEDAAVFTGGRETTKGFSLTYAEPVVMYIPPTPDKGKITILSATRNLVAGSFK